LSEKDDAENAKWTRKVEKRSATGRSADSPSSRAKAIENPQSTIREEPNKGKNKSKGKTVSKGNDGDRYVVKHEDGWAVKKENAERASGVFRTQKEAIDRAREIVDRSSGGDGEVRIQNREGKFRDSDSGRNNESKAKDTK
jgi:hypothetical protein